MSPSSSLPSHAAMRVWRPSARWRTASLLIPIALLATACARYVVTGRHVVPSAPMPDSVVLTYLGSGGWLIESGGAALLTGPHLSNPNAITRLAWRLRVDTAMIDNRLASLRPRLSKARTILIGHGHYDHLMDVPYVANTYAPDAAVFGSRTVYNHVLGWGLPKNRLVIVDDSAGSHEDPGRWITDASRHFRVLPVRSEHSPHFQGIHLFQGERMDSHDAFPTSAFCWVEGPTYAYLIDVLDGAGTAFFRIYYQDSGANPPMGHPAPSTARPSGVPMVAILTAPGHRWVRYYPDSILAELRPDFVLTSHWEDFLTRRADKAPRPIPLTYFPEWRAKMLRWSATRSWIPAPLSTWVFKANPFSKEMEER